MNHKGSPSVQQCYCPFSCSLIKIGKDKIREELVQKVTFVLYQWREENLHCISKPPYYNIQYKSILLKILKSLIFI